MIWSNDMMTIEGKDGKDVQVPAAQYVGGACIGVANESDTAAVNRIIRSAAAKRLLPTDFGSILPISKRRRCSSSC